MNLLLVGGLAEQPDREMLEGVYGALEGSGIHCDVIYRKHPHSAIRQSLFRESCLPLQEEIRSADLILFTYSTVAEEAFIQGKPVWQWKTSAADASALAQIIPIELIDSPERLRVLLADFMGERNGIYTFTPLDRDYVREQLFYKTDGQAAKRISEIIIAKHFSNRSNL